MKERRGGSKSSLGFFRLFFANFDKNHVKIEEYSSGWLKNMTDNVWLEDLVAKRLEWDENSSLPHFSSTNSTTLSIVPI